MRRKGREEGPFLRSGGRWEKDQRRAVETHAEVVFCGASYEESRMDSAHDTDCNVDTLDYRCKTSPYRDF